MPDFETLIDDLNENSKRIGETVRTTSLGFLGSVFLIFTSKELNAFFQVELNKTPLLWIGALCLTTLVVDYSQALCGYCDSYRNCKLLSVGKGIDNKSIYKKLRNILFITKQILLFIALTVFISLIYSIFAR